jgi:bile acid-coenzyme A ligase
MVTHLALIGGASVVGMERFDAETTLKLIEDHRVAYVCLVPTMMHRIWRLGEAARAACDLSSLREVWHMAAPMPPWLKEAWIEWLGPERIFELYGGTEGQGHTTISGAEWLRHRGSVGKPVEGRLRILDEDGKALCAGEVGEIYFSPAKGASYHYLGAEPRSTADGWESLGDFGWLDTDGYLYIADRRTDMILSGGANIYPAEVEGALMEHPEVAEAVVIGLPDEDLGASVHAIIRLASGGVGETALAAFLAERLARSKIPRSFEFTQAFLRDDAGKVRRSRLRQERMARGA